MKKIILLLLLPFLLSSQNVHTTAKYVSIEDTTTGIKTRLIETDLDVDYEGDIIRVDSEKMQLYTILEPSVTRYTDNAMVTDIKAINWEGKPCKITFYELDRGPFDHFIIRVDQYIIRYLILKEERR